MAAPKLSFIIPAYNGASRLGVTLQGVFDYFQKQNYSWEVIVVDDGSGDDTVAVAESFDAAFEGKLRVIKLGNNMGKGAAVKRGILEAQGQFRIFSDADASTPVEEVGPMLVLLEAGADVVIASRALPESDVQIHQSWYREQMGRIFNRILKAFALTPYKDTQCGFKGFTAAAAHSIFPRQTVQRFSFDVELLYIARLHGLKLQEMPVVWRNSPQSTVHPLKDSFRMLVDMLRIRINAVSGKYK